MVTETQLRGVLQLPARPYSDTILYDGSRYYDLSHFEPLQIFNLIGVLGAFSAFNFTQNTDYALESGVIDFGIGGSNPQLGTPFIVDYSHSPLGSSSASTSMWIASTTVYQQLASAFPYGSTSATGVAFNDLATLGTLMVAAREACVAIAGSESEQAVKYRRGSILMDETQKSKNWMELSKEWEAKYQKYINMIRPGGRPSVMRSIVRDMYSFVFPSDSYGYREMAYLVQDEYGTYGGAL